MTLRISNISPICAFKRSFINYFFCTKNQQCYAMYYELSQLHPIASHIYRLKLKFGTSVFI